MGLRTDLDDETALTDDRSEQVEVRGSVPSVPAFAVRRPRLEALIDAHPDRRVVLVHGAAGAGKTVLVAQWLAVHAQGCCWLTIDESHDDPQVLLRRLVEVAEQLCPDAAQLRPDEVGVAAAPSVGPFDDGALRDVLGAVVRHRGTAIDLVLDGVDRLRGGASQRVVARLVEDPPDAVRVILIARSRPCVGIERARLRDDLIEIGLSALRFERNEIDALAATWNGRSGNGSQLEQETLGWAAGLRLAALDEASWPGRPGPDVYADEYVREELIDGSTPELRSFLEITCWLPHITGPLCAAVAGQRSGSPSLTLSEVQALPVLSIASRPGVFRYPPVLVKALQREYRRRDPRAVARAQRRAAEAARECNELVPAVELFLEAGQADEAAATCAELTAGAESSLVGIDELFHRRPEIAPTGVRGLTCRVRAAVTAGHLDEASSLLQRLEELGSAGEAGPADDENHVIAQAAVAERLGDVTTMLACAEHLMVTVPRANRWTATEVTARCWRIRAFVWSGEAGRARAELARLEASTGEHAEAAVPLALARAWVAWLDGDVSLVERLTAQAPGCHADEHVELALLAGIARREGNHRAAAIARLQEARTHTHNVVAALAASELARCHRTAGATMEALELAISARRSFPRLPPAVGAHLQVTEARIRLDNDDTDGAHAIARAAQPSVDTRLLAARIALRHAPDLAAELLDSAATSTARQAVERLLLRAQLPDATSAEVSIALMKAVHTGGPLGLVRTFLDEGPAVCRLLAELASDSSDRALGRIGALASQELARGPTPAETAPMEKLTTRELAVLRMLPLRLSNREMADQLYISINTLKTHVRAIYRKLDVPDRAAAVRRANALELI